MTFTNPIINVDGIGPISTQFEVTNGSMASAYTDAIMAFVNVMQLQPTASNPFPATQVSAINVTQINDALTQLTNLAKYGIIVTTSGNVIIPSSVVSAGFLTAHHLTNGAVGPGQSTYAVYQMTTSMAQDYNSLVQSLAAVGINVSATGNNKHPTVTLNSLQQWVDLSVQVSAISGVVQAAELDGLTGSQSLQSMIELDYVQTGNELITNNMNQLNSALNVTQSVLTTLSQLQNLANQVTTTNSIFNFNYQSSRGNDNSGAPSAWSPIYQQAASAFFNTPVTPVLVSAINNDAHINHYNSAVLGLIQLRNTLAVELTQLSGISSASTISNPTSLYATVKQVLTDISASFQFTKNANFGFNGQINSTLQIPWSTGLIGTPYFSTNSYDQQFFVAALSGFKSWVLDNYSSFTAATANQAGQYQQHMTTAITAGENLNDTQKETVRNFLFIFQEYYQSASSALQAITQIIQQMARNISQ